MKSIRRGGGVLSVEKMNWSYMGISKTLFHNFLGLESSKSPSLYLLALLFILFPYSRQSHSLSVGVGESGLGFKPQSSLTLSTLRSHSALPAVHAKGSLSECCMKKKSSDCWSVDTHVNAQRAAWLSWWLSKTPAVRSLHFCLCFLLFWSPLA